MTADGDEGGGDDYVRFRVVAYRLADRDGWDLAEMALSLEEFGSALLREGDALIALREIHTGFQRVAPGEAFQATGMSFLLIHNWGWTFDERADCWRAPDENIKPPSSPSERVDSVRVEFGRPNHGWLPIKIAAGNQEIAFRASDLDCPFPRILGWLEKLVEGEEGRIVADLEGSEAESFSFATDDPARARVVASLSGNLAPDENRKVCLDIEVDRCLFARTFYASLRAYAESPLFDFTRWAAIPMQEDLARRGFAMAAAELAAFSRAALRQWLWKLYPAYLDDSAPGETQSIVQGYERLEGVVETPDPHRTPFHLFEIALEYDGWGVSRRTDYIAELLRENINDSQGTDLRKLRSEKLEALLVSDLPGRSFW